MKFKVGDKVFVHDEQENPLKWNGIKGIVSDIKIFSNGCYYYILKIPGHPLSGIYPFEESELAFTQKKLKLNLP